MRRCESLWTAQQKRAEQSTGAAVGALGWAVSVARLSRPVAMCCVGELVWKFGRAEVTVETPVMRDRLGGGSTHVFPV